MPLITISFFLFIKSGKDNKPVSHYPNSKKRNYRHLYKSSKAIGLIHYFCFMEVNDELIDKVAHLARLQFNEVEKASIKKDLQKMIVFVEKLNELDTTGVAPLLHMSENINVLREDKIKGSISNQEALKNAPLHDNQFFKVPKVIKK